jgi:hypothetical protein
LGFTRPFGRFEPGDARPCLIGSLKVTAPPSGRNGELILDGLLISAPAAVPAITVLPQAGETTSGLDSLRLRYCTLAPLPPQGGGQSAPELTVSDCPRLALSLERSISGPVVVTASQSRDPLASLSIDTSILHGLGGFALDAAATPAMITASTLLGDARLRRLQSYDSLFDGACLVERRQAGCARFSYFGPGSRTPRRYRCQPDLAQAKRAEELSPVKLTDDEAQRIAGRLRPQFCATTYGDPAFALLDLQTAIEIRTGAESGAEMGAFEHLKLAQGEQNLRQVLDEYLPFGLEAGIFYRS